MNRTRAPHVYNAAAIGYDAEGKKVSTEAVRFENGRVVRAAGLWSHLNGLPEFHDSWLRGKCSFIVRVDILDVDPMVAYRAAIGGGAPLAGRVLATFAS
jgi:hypothetical protein